MGVAVSGDGDVAGDDRTDDYLPSGEIARGSAEKCGAGSDVGYDFVVGGERAVWILCAASSVRSGVRRIGGGDWNADLDAFVGDDYFFGSGVERGIGG